MGMSKRVITALVAFIMVIAGFSGVATADNDHEHSDHKVWVCKYVGTPGTNERLKDGKNPIEVDSNATAGTWFNDRHGRSYVLGSFNVSPGLSACPSPDDGFDWVAPQYPPFNPQACTEYRFEKATSTWSSLTGTWSAWVDWPGAGPLSWGNIPNPRTGHHGGTHEADGDRHFAYVVVSSRPITTGSCAPATTTTVKEETTTTQETTTTVQDTTTTDKATTTTQKATTTTAGATTTSEAPTTTVDPGTTTTLVSTGTSPTPPPTPDTVVEPSNPPALPATGGGVNPDLVWGGLIFLGIGVFAIMAARRPTPRN